MIVKTRNNSQQENSLFLVLGLWFPDDMPGAQLNLVPIANFGVLKNNFLKCIYSPEKRLLPPCNLKDFVIVEDLTKIDRKMFVKKNGIYHQETKSDTTIYQKRMSELNHTSYRWLNHQTYGNNRRNLQDQVDLYWVDPVLMDNNLILYVNNMDINEPWQEKVIVNYVKNTMTVYVKNIDKLPKPIAKAIKGVIKNPGNDVNKDVARYFQKLLK